MDFSRRIFIKRTTASVALLSSIPAIINNSCITPKEKSQSILSLKKNSTILFQGDSITDAGREKEKELPNNFRSFGQGYAFLAASALLKDFPDKNLTIYNRGVSGNKVYQLADRWEKDCLNLSPNVLSILIGVNDYWHKRDGFYNGTIDVYEKDYRKLLNLTKEALPDIQLVICEPFYVLNTSVVDDTWVKPMQQYQEVARKLSYEFGTLWVPFQKVFDEAIKHAPATYWTEDGVHPSMPGAQLMAEAWLQVVKG